ncbi:MAG: hypothetical protein P9L90_05275 [Candidatus Aadella gelida]|nr:hypothetical protein [Candidatus Aadella gelida]
MIEENTIKSPTQSTVTKRIMVSCTYAIKEKPNGQERTIKKKALLADCYMEAYGTVAKACRMAGVSRWTFYDWYKKDPKFAHIIRSAMDRKLKEVEIECRKM